MLDPFLSLKQSNPPSTNGSSIGYRLCCVSILKPIDRCRCSHSSVPLCSELDIHHCSVQPLSSATALSRLSHLLQLKAWTHPPPLCHFLSLLLFPAAIGSATSPPLIAPPVSQSSLTRSCSTMPSTRRGTSPSTTINHTPHSSSTTHSPTPPATRSSSPTLSTAATQHVQ